MTEELRQSLRRAMLEASSRRHEYVTLEHLLLALCSDPVGARVLQAVGVRLPRLVRDVEEFLDHQLETLPPALSAETAEEAADPTAGTQAAGEEEGTGRANGNQDHAGTEASGDEEEDEQPPSRRWRSGAWSSGPRCTLTARARARSTPAP